MVEGWAAVAGSCPVTTPVLTDWATMLTTATVETAHATGTAASLSRAAFHDTAAGDTALRDPRRKRAQSHARCQGTIDTAPAKGHQVSPPLQ